MYVCMYVCIYKCMYVCINVSLCGFYIYNYIYMYICSVQSGNLHNPQITLLNTRSTECCQSADWHTIVQY